MEGWGWGQLQMCDSGEGGSGVGRWWVQIPPWSHNTQRSRCEGLVLAGLEELTGLRVSWGYITSEGRGLAGQVWWRAARGSQPETFYIQLFLYIYIYIHKLYPSKHFSITNSNFWIFLQVVVGFSSWMWRRPTEVKLSKTSQKKFKVAHNDEMRVISEETETAQWEESTLSESVTIRWMESVANADRRSKYLWFFYCSAEEMAYW